MTIDLANTLFDDGIFSTLYKSGFISTKIFVYREIYNWVHEQIQLRGISKNQAVLEAEIHFNRDERTVWRALDSFTEKN